MQIILPVLWLFISLVVDHLDCSVQDINESDGELELTPAAPNLANLCHEEDNDVDHIYEGTSKTETTHKKASFIIDIRGVEPFNSQPRFSEVQKKAQRFCEWPTTGFPGSHPVSIDNDNLKKLHEKPYRVSWKPDGFRYLMLIDGEDEVYMLDRDNCAFKVFGLRFPDRKNLRRHLNNTLIDGEMVIYKVDNKDIPRFLVYDIVNFEGTDTGKMDFYPNRLNYIDREIIKPRHQAIKEGIIKEELEPFSIQLKQFWDLSKTRELLSENFTKTLSHENEGLIFQASKGMYAPGPDYNQLKWKPNDLNTVDFKLKIVTQGGQGILPTKVGYLCIGQMDQPFASINVTEDIKHLHNKIIECYLENGQWVFLWQRTDKSFPNDYATVIRIDKSIKYAVTKEVLLDYIDNHRFQDDSDMMPPPKSIRR